MDDRKGKAFKVVGSFNRKQSLVTNVLRKNGLEPYDNRRHQEEDIAVLINCEPDYKKSRLFVKRNCRSGGRLVKEKWIEDLKIKIKALNLCDTCLWEELVCVDGQSLRDDVKNSLGHLCDGDEPHSDLEDDDDFGDNDSDYREDDSDDDSDDEDGCDDDDDETDVEATHTESSVDEYDEEDPGYWLEDYAE